MNKLCAKCNENERRPGQRWCRECHAEYMRNNRPKHYELSEEAKMKSACRSFANTYQERGH